MSSCSTRQSAKKSLKELDESGLFPKWMCVKDKKIYVSVSRAPPGTKYDTGCIAELLRRSIEKTKTKKKQKNGSFKVTTKDVGYCYCNFIHSRYVPGGTKVRAEYLRQAKIGDNKVLALSRKKNVR